MMSIRGRGEADLIDAGKAAAEQVEVARIE
jgi:hypothetical protein